jgi:hypothetical protein
MFHKKGTKAITKALIYSEESEKFTRSSILCLFLQVLTQPKKNTTSTSGKYFEKLRPKANLHWSLGVIVSSSIAPGAQLKENKKQ